MIMKRKKSKRKFTTSLLSTPISTCRHLPKAVRNEFGRSYEGLPSSFVAHPIMSNSKLLMAFVKCTLFPLRRGGLRLRRERPAGSSCPGG